MTDPTGTQSYSYDDPGNTLSVTTHYTGLPAQTISYAYYPDGSRQSMTTPAGVFSYKYDALAASGQPHQSLRQNLELAILRHRFTGAANTRQHAWTNYRYNEHGQLIRLTNHSPRGQVLSDLHPGRLRRQRQPHRPHRHRPRCPAVERQHQLQL